MKKTLALLLALVMALSLVACGSKNNTPAPEKTPDTTTEKEPEKTPDPAPEAPAEATDITLWTYPVGNWGDQATVKAITDKFTAETGINVTVEYLTYQDGDDKVNTALAAGQAPDLVLEGPERLVANWGAKGYMVDLADMLDDEDKSELYDSVKAACINAEGACYEYPMVMTAHCMAVNLDAFKEAGADQYLDLETRTWTTEGFINAVNALYDHYGTPAGAVFCAGQGGDQGTRALVNNLYGGTFTTADHTAYTWDDEKNIKALQTLYDLEGIVYDPAIVGGDEMQLFYNETFKMAFCWNINGQMNEAYGAGKTINGQEIVPMAFPTESGDPKLQGGIWGLGVFDNGDQGRIDAAKKFVKFVCDSANTVDAVRASNFFPVRDSADGTDLSNVWSDSPVMNEYMVLMPYLGDYYQVTKGWAEARTAWWNMLQGVGNGQDVATVVADYCGQANASANG